MSKFAPPPSAASASISYAPVTVTAGAASGASAGSLTTTLTGTVSWSVLAGALAVNATTGALTTTGTAPNGGTITGTVAADNGSDLVGKHIAVPVAAVLASLGPSAVNSTQGATAGTVITAITGKALGSTLSITPSTGYVALSGDDTSGWKLVVGLTAAPLGSVAYTITETLAGAVGSPKTSTITVSTISAMQPLRVVGSPSRFPNRPNGGSAGSNFGMVRRQPFYVGSGGVASFVLSFANAFATMNDATTGSTINIIAASLEMDGGATVPVTFSGSRTKTLNWKDVDIQSDAISASAFSLSSIPQGTLMWWKLVMALPNSSATFLAQDPPAALTGTQMYLYPPGSVTPPSIDSSGTFSTTGLTADGGSFPGVIVLGRHASPARTFGGVGDSLFRDSVFAYSTFINPLLTHADNFERMLVNPIRTSFVNEPGALQDASDVLAGLNFGVFGSGIVGYDPTQDYRSSYYKYCTDMVEEYGSNDGGSTQSQIQTALTTLWAKMTSSGVSRIWRTKFHPYTTSTDNWATTANQTYETDHAPGGKYDLLNQWFATKNSFGGDGSIYGVIEWGRIRAIGSYASNTWTPEDFYKWRATDSVAGYATGDGHHPSAFAGCPMCTDEGHSYIANPGASAPAAVTLTVATTDTTATLTWSAPAQPVQNYLIEFKPHSGGTWYPINTYDYATAHSIQGLSASTSYDFRITAKNYAGAGTVSSVVTMSTTAAPTGLLADGITLSSYYAMRRVRSSWTGGLIRARRDRDGMEFDIYAGPTGATSDGRDLDTAFLSGWLGAGAGRSKRRYDQIGGAHQNALTVSTSVAQWPALSAVNGRPVEAFVQSRSNGYAASTLSAQPTARSMVTTLRRSAGTGGDDNGILGGKGGMGGGGGFTMFLDQSSGQVKVAAINVDYFLSSSVNITRDSLNHLISVNYATSNQSLFIDRAAAGSSTSATTFSGSGTGALGAINADGGSTVDGLIPEMAILDGATLTTTNRQTIENSQRAYWGTV